MLDIVRKKDENLIVLSGRFDASQTEKAQEVFQTLTESSIIDVSDLDYISSAGLGVLLATLKRLTDMGKSLRLLNMNKHVRDVFKYSGLDRVFEIE